MMLVHRHVNDVFRRAPFFSQAEDHRVIVESSVHRQRLLVQLARKIKCSFVLVPNEHLQIAAVCATHV